MDQEENAHHVIPLSHQQVTECVWTKGPGDPGQGDTSLVFLSSSEMLVTWGA